MDYPAQRDFVKELAVTCRKAGLGLFIYYSVGIDWHHPYFCQIRCMIRLVPTIKRFLSLTDSVMWKILSII